MTSVSLRQKWSVQTTCEVEELDASVQAETFEAVYVEAAPPAEFRYGLGSEEIDAIVTRFTSWAEQALGIRVALDYNSVVLHSEHNKYGEMYSVFNRWIDDNGITDDADHMRLEATLEIFPIPTFGSPPSGWESITAKVRGSGFVALMGGTFAATDRPVMVLYEAAAVTVIWFVRPSARVARRALAARIAKSLGAELRPEDEV